ncbi:MAG: DMT family transporter [Actinomycetota bacterium]
MSELVEPSEAAPGDGRRSVMSTTTGTHLGAFTPLDWVLFLSVGLIWGSSFLLIAVGLDAFAPGLVTWLRIVFGASALWLVPAARPGVHREDLPRLVSVSVLWIAIPFTLFPLAEQHIASGITGLINGALPIFAVAFGSIMLRRAPGRAQALGLAVGFLGIVAIASPSSSEGSSEAIGVLMALAATVCYGVAINLTTPLTQRYGSLPVFARVIGIAAILTLPFGIVSVPDSSFAWSSFVAVVVLGVMGTGVAFVLMGRLVARVGARASFATYLIPVVALILGVVFRDEVIHVLSVVGIGLVIAGALLASRKERDA